MSDISGQMGRLASGTNWTCPVCHHSVSFHRDLNGDPRPCDFETERSLPDDTPILCGCEEGAK